MKSQDFIKNMLKFCVPTIVSAIVGVVVLPLISRVYPEAEYGYVNNFFSVGNMLMGLVFLGLDQAYIRFYNEPPEDSTRSGLLIFSLTTGLIVTAALFVGLLLIVPGWISGLLFNDARPTGILLLGVYVMGLVFYRVTNINYRFSNRAGAYNIQQVCFILGNRLLFVLAVLFSTRYIYSVAIMTGIMLAIAVISMLQQRREFQDAQISRGVKGEMLRFALPMMPAGVIVLLNNSIANLVLGGFGLRAEVGVLAIATSASYIFSIIPNAFTTYWGAFMYKYYNQEQERIKSIHDYVMLLSIVLVIGIIIFQDLLYLYLGENYRASQPYLLLIMTTPIVALLGETTSYGIALAKKTKYTLYISVLSCALNALVCYLLIPVIGAFGAALGIAVSATVGFAARTVIAQKLYRSIISYARTLLGCVLLWGLCIGNIWLAENMALRAAAVLIVGAAAMVLYRESLQALWTGARAWISKKGS